MPEIGPLQSRSRSRLALKICNRCTDACASRLAPRAVCLAKFLHERTGPISGPTPRHDAAVADEGDRSGPFPVRC